MYTPTPRTLVLFGVRKSGKDTIGDLLAAHHGFTKEAFANPLKQMVKIAFPAFTDEDLYGPSSRRNTQYKEYPMGESCLRCNGPLFDNTEGGLSCTERGCIDDYPQYVSPRIALQTLGTEWGRRLYKHVWVDAAFARVRMAQQPPWREGPFVITDGRFISEHEQTVIRGAFTVLLLRGLEESTDTHPSEAEVKLIPRENFHWVIDNRGAIEELPGLVETMMEAWRRS